MNRTSHSAKRTRPLTFLLIISLIARIQSQNADTGGSTTAETGATATTFFDWKTVQKSSCEKIDVESLVNLTIEERTEKMKKHKNLFSGKYEGFLTFVRSTDPLDYINGAQGVNVVGIIFFGISFFMFLFFMFYLCFPCCLKKDEFNIKKCKIIAGILIALTLVFVAMFIVLLFVSIKLTGTVDKTNCSISTIPTELLEGVNNSKHQYLGLSNTINNLSDFNDESGKIKESLGINFDNINSELLRESSEKVIKSVTSYANQNKENKSIDAEGKTAKPFNVSAMTEFISDAIQKELEHIDGSISKLIISTESGKNLTEGENLNTMLLNFDKSLDSMRVAENEVKKYFSSLVDYLNMSTNYFSQLMWVCIGFASVVLVVVTFTQVCFLMRRRDKCHGTRCLTRFFMFFFAFFAFLLGAVLLSLIAVNFTMTSICDFTFESLVDPKVSENLKDKIPYQIRGFFSEQCIGTEGFQIGEYVLISNSILRENLASIDTFLDGISYYDNFLKNLAPDKNNNSIQVLANEWDLYKEGLKDNYDNVKVILARLNSQVAPCQENYVLNSKQCTEVGGVGTCKSIATEETFKNTRECITQPDQALQDFDNLKNYLNAQHHFIEAMIEDLNGFNGNTPRVNYEELRNKMNKIQHDFKTIRNTLDKTFTRSSQFDFGWKDITNCKNIMRREFLLFNAGVCFDFMPESYNFFQFLFVAHILLLIIIWLTCVLDRELGGEVPEEKNEDDLDFEGPTDPGNSKDKDDIEDLRSDEDDEGLESENLMDTQSNNNEFQELQDDIDRKKSKTGRSLSRNNDQRVRSKWLYRANQD